MRPLLACAALAAIVAAPFGQAASGECTARSGPGTAALVELYTSEGCDSCPPADEWLRKLRAAGFGPESVVPLALHVDYWDYIGWKDPFASAAFGARQRELNAINRSRVVYTPQVLLAGRDYRNWSGAGRFGTDVRAVNAAPARAQIELALRGPEIRAAAAVPKSDDRVDTALYVAVYENGLSNRVTAGENRGVTLAARFRGPRVVGADRARRRGHGDARSQAGHVQSREGRRGGVRPEPPDRWRVAGAGAAGLLGLTLRHPRSR